MTLNSAGVCNRSMSTCVVGLGLTGCVLLGAWGSGRQRDLQ